MRRTCMQCNAHDDMIKCNTQANDMATTANNWQTPGASNLGRYTMFHEDDIFCPRTFDVQIFYNDCMPPIYDDYIDESGFGRVS